MNTSEYAKGLMKTHGPEHALKIAEYCATISKGLLTAEEVPGVGEEIEVYEESFKAKDGSLQVREKIRIDGKLQSKRLKKSAAFWLETANLVKKFKAAAEQKKNAQT